MFRKDFDRDIAAELRIASAIDFAHATAADLFDDPVIGKLLALERRSMVRGHRFEQRLHFTLWSRSSSPSRAPGESNRNRASNSARSSGAIWRSARNLSRSAGDRSASLWNRLSSNGFMMLPVV